MVPSLFHVFEWAIVLIVPSLLSAPVLAELQQANLITSEECEGLENSSDVVAVQRMKSPEVMIKSSEILLKHGNEEESKLLAGRQMYGRSSAADILWLVVCTLEPNCPDHFHPSSHTYHVCMSLYVHSDIMSPTVLLSHIQSICCCCIGVRQCMSRCGCGCVGMDGCV